MLILPLHFFSVVALISTCRLSFLAIRFSWLFPRIFSSSFSGTLSDIDSSIDFSFSSNVEFPEAANRVTSAASVSTEKTRNLFIEHLLILICVNSHLNNVRWATIDRVGASDSIEVLLLEIDSLCEGGGAWAALVFRSSCNSRRSEDQNRIRSDLLDCETKANLAMIQDAIDIVNYLFI